ncbi:hypothetical protein K504DRAFT_477829 [Pleomassaria siparia CBS 279.74]|uniref:LisH domain-containing protein n=1 Tax=Pleomassaria siparia CBS 279.74 TaxID=1314801 RepID=A0A6G1K7Y9_9PLEO|nr:hypothetical protein K504DRAFT_477829 [Pleomassaria siparia CBS 279.74]
MTVEALSSNVVNYLVWRYLQEAGYGNAALQLSRCWIRDPETLPFAKNVSQHTLVNLLQDGLWFDKLQAEAANVDQRYHFGHDHGRPFSVRNGALLTLDQGIPAHQLAEAEEVNGAVQEPPPRKGAMKRKRAKTNGIEPRMMNPQTNGDAMDVEQNGNTHVTNSVRAESEAMASEAESPTVAEIPISTLSIGQSTEIQTEKITDLAPKTRFDATIKEGDKVVEQTLWGAELLLTAGQSLLRLHLLPKDDDSVLQNGDTNMGGTVTTMDLNQNLPMTKFSITALCWISSDEVAVSAREELVNEIGETMKINRMFKITDAGKNYQVISSTGGLVTTLRWNKEKELLLSISTDGEQGSIKIWKNNNDSIPAWNVRTETTIFDALWISDASFVVCGIGLFQVYDVGEDLTIQRTLETRITWETLKYDAASGIMAALGIEGQTSYLGILHPNDSLTLQTHEYPDPYFTSLDFRPQQPTATPDPNVLPVLPFGPAPTPSVVLATCSASGVARIWDANQPFKSLKRLPTTDDSQANNVCFSPDGSLLAAAGPDAVTIWDMEQIEKREVPIAAWRAQDCDQSNWDPSVDGEFSLGWDADSCRLSVALGNQIAIIPIPRHPDSNTSHPDSNTASIQLQRAEKYSWREESHGMSSGENVESRGGVVNVGSGKLDRATTVARMASRTPKPTTKLWEPLPFPPSSVTFPNFMSAVPNLPNSLLEDTPVLPSHDGSKFSLNGVANGGRQQSPFKLHDSPIENFRPIKVIVIGAGYSGIYCGIRMPEKIKNLELVIYEKNAGVGGTWYENKYLGCACDVPSHSYQYSFASNPNWSSLYAPAPEIQAYLARTAVKYSADRFIKLSHEITECRWDDKTGRWNVKVKNLATGETKKDWCDVLISGRGNLNNPSWPQIDGLKEFKGEIMHSATWNDQYDFQNKRIAVIGSGSSSIQIVPGLQRIAGTHTTVFARSKTWISPSFGQQLFDKYGFEGFIIPNDVKEKFKNREYYEKFRLSVEEDGNAIHGVTIKGTPLQQDGKELFTAHMRETLKSKPEIFEKLLPTFSPGCRRLTPGPGYLEALTQDNVAFVTEPITKISENAVHTQDGKTHEVDALVCATGFQASAPPPFPVIGTQGLTLSQKWSLRPMTYLSHSISSFPNLFTMLGPNSAIGSGSLITMIEAVGDYVIKCVRKIQKDNIRSMSVRREREEDFIEYVDKYFEGTVFSEECRSWYKNKGEGLEGSGGKITGLWPGSTQHCVEAMRSPRWEDFEYTYVGEEEEEDNDEAVDVDEVEEIPEMNRHKKRNVNGEGKKRKKKRRVNRMAWLGNGWSVNQLEERHLAWYLYPEFLELPVAPLPEENAKFKIRPFSY